MTTTMKAGFKGFRNGLKDICFPPVCLSCEKRLSTFLNILFCDDCAGKIKLISEPVCTVCGKGFPCSGDKENHLCSTCIKKPRHFSKARGVVYYTDPVSTVIHAFKYGGKMTALQTFASFKNQLPHLGDMAEADLILPVPLHPKRLRERGFNQALVLAKTFFPDRKEKIRPMVLERCRWTDPQTSLSGEARRKNLKNAFRVKGPLAVKGKKILLVDDVYTTGTTVDECARILRKNGAVEVAALTLARVEE